uniref:long-chain-fatty-acid--CoA ligase n=1 Tax=Gopherus agassizii TaxID=38772 RepID=A0A452GWM7_9SAUR
MAAIVLRPGCELDGAQLYSHVVEFLPPYARPRFLRVQDHLETTQTFKQHKVRLASEGCDPTRLPDPLYLLDDASEAYVPLTPRLWEGVVSGAVRI